MIRQGMLPGVDPREGGQQLHQGAQQGHPQGDVEDGHLDAAELLRRADLRGDRPEPGVRRPVLHADTPSRIGGVGIEVVAEEVCRRHERAFPTRPVTAARARGRRRVPVAPRRRVPPVQPGDGVQAAARDAQRRSTRSSRSTRRLVDDQSRAAARRCAACSGFKPAGAAGPDRRGRAGRGDRQALRDRRDVVRLDQPGGARDAGDRHEPHRRQVEHRRGRRGRRALHAATPTATGGAARSSRWPRAASA